MIAVRHWPIWSTRPQAGRASRQTVFRSQEKIRLRSLLLLTPNSWPKPRYTFVLIHVPDMNLPAPSPARHTIVQHHARPSPEQAAPEVDAEKPPAAHAEVMIQHT